MSGNDRSAMAPHPVLTKYYAREGDRRRFVTTLFDRGAKHYDRVCGVGSLGSGQFYRRWVLRSAGLRPGMKLLDVATGTGLVARSALHILRERRAVIGIDPSPGMLDEARRHLPVALVQGTIDELPFEDDHFDVVSMGYALRHVDDLGVAFGECLRVLKPGGRLVILEMSRPRGAVSRWLVRGYLQVLLPLVMRVTTGSADAGLLTKYYWDTIAECVPPETIMKVLAASGFTAVSRRARAGLLSEYLASKPAKSVMSQHPTAT